MIRQALVIAALACALAASATAAVSGWRVIKSGSSSGDFAVQAITATISHPAGIEVRLSGGVSTGSGVIACSHGFAISSWHRQYGHAGTYRLPMTRGADSCDVVASVGGAGRVTVQILSYR